MNGRRAARSGTFAAAACVACCAPPIIATLGVTVGLAATVGVFAGLAGALTVLLLGGAWLGTRVARWRAARRDAMGASPPPSTAVAVDGPTRRQPTSLGS